MRQTTPTTTATSSNNNNISNTSWIFRIHQGHERIKKAVHEGMRIPLPRWGQRVMALVYFSTPILGGYAVMQWAIGKSHASIGPNGEFLPNRNQPIGQPPPPRELQQKQQQVPVYGVALASSNEESQRKNKEKLQRFLRQQFKQQNKQPKQQEETKETSRVA